MNPLLKKIVAINLEMTPLVKSLQWEDVLALTGQRDDYIKEYFKISPIPDEPSIVSDIMNEIVRSDQEISELMAKEKTKLIDQSLSLKKSHSAIQQYQYTQTG